MELIIVFGITEDVHLLPLWWQRFALETPAVPGILRETSSRHSNC
jgi:hypothetical protein